jgi:agmatinase
MWNRNIDAFLGCTSDYEAADIVLFGAPFDGTTSYRPGTRFGPAAIRRESYGFETYSPHLDKDLLDLSVFDGGDLELGFGNTERVLAEIEAKTAMILADGKLPFMLGGEHLVTLGSVRSVVKSYPDLKIIHFDAHTDLRDDYLGERLSHASVIRRCHELTGDNSIFQFGIRSGERAEFLWGSRHTGLHRYSTEGLAPVIYSLAGRPVYLTVDLDVLDPSVFPGTGTPEPGGIGFEELRKALTSVCSLCNVVACDVVELSPPYDPSGISTAAAIKIVREMLLSLSCTAGIK